MNRGVASPPDRERAIEAMCRASYPDYPRCPNPAGVRANAEGALDALDDLGVLNLDADPIPDLASGETFRAIRAAISDPAYYCTQLTSYPPPLRQMEPIDRWQTRAVMCALGRLIAPPQRHADTFIGEHMPDQGDDDV